MPVPPFVFTRAAKELFRVVLVHILTYDGDVAVETRFDDVLSVCSTDSGVPNLLTRTGEACKKRNGGSKI